MARRRRSRRTRKSLALVFAVVFAPLAAQRARAGCVPFSSPPAISTDSPEVVSVVACDVDHDGDLDLVTASPGAGIETVWFENGGGGSTWSPRTDAVFEYGQHVAVAADVDSDGDEDLVTTDFAGLSWIENLGDEASWAHHRIATPAGVGYSVLAVDLDGDGDLDVVGPRTDGTLTWYANDGGGGGWSAHGVSTAVADARSLVAADLDGDGDPDLAVAIPSTDTILWFKNDGSGGGWLPATVSSAALDEPWALAVGDLDRDGDLDLVSAGRLDDQLVWFENSGSGAGWTATAISTAADAPYVVHLADLDGDGDLDVASGAADDLVRWHENRGAGATWSLHTLGGAPDTPRGLAAGDLDGDGDLDLAVVSKDDGTVAWYRNGTVHGEALFLPGSILSTASTGPNWVTVADIDGDGDLDALVASSWDGELAWYQNDGTGGGWTGSRIGAMGDYSYFVSTADIDGDGDTDVFAALGYPDLLTWYENDGTPLNGGWKTHEISSAVSYAYAILAADIDGDGDIDAISASADDNLIAWYENDGTPETGSWLQRTISASALGAVAAFAADLDDDGDLDVLSASATDDKLAWYENDGTPLDGGWVTHTITTGATGAAAVSAADLDGDGDLDAIASAAGIDLLAWYENDGTPLDGGWTIRTISTAAVTAYSVTPADVDGDGDLDILWTSSYNALVMWHENDGTPVDGGWVVHTLAVSAIGALSVAAADLDRDGDLDALSVSYGNDQLAWYPNLGTRLFADGFDSDADTVCWSTATP